MVHWGLTTIITSGGSGLAQPGGSSNGCGGPTTNSHHSQPQTPPYLYARGPAGWKCLCTLGGLVLLNPEAGLLRSKSHGVPQSLLFGEWHFFQNLNKGGWHWFFIPLELTPAGFAKRWLRRGQIELLPPLWMPSKAAFYVFMSRAEEK